jgi:GNAT superfamily N-acetyltransferase
MTKLARLSPTELDTYLSKLFKQQLVDNQIDYQRQISEDVAIGAYADDGQLVGGLLMNRRYDHVYISRLAVDPTYRGHRLGTQLVQAAEAWAREQQVLTMTLSTRDYQAVDFYLKCGFQIYGKVADLPFKGVTTVYFVKRLID